LTGRQSYGHLSGVSNGFHPDALSVHYLAAELARRLRGRSCGLAPALGPSAVSLPLDRGEELRVGMGPGDVDVALVPARSAQPEARVAAVQAPPDDRCLLIHLEGGSRFRPVRRVLRIEWYGARRNALLLDPESGRVVAAAHERPGGPRPVRVGERLTEHAPAPRLRLEDADEAALRARWRQTVSAAPPDDRRAALLRTFAWTGPLNARFILWEEEGDGDAAFDRWRALAVLPGADPVVLDTPRGPRAYPLPLPGASGQAAPSLLDAVATARSEAGRAEDAEQLTRARADIARRLERAEARADRLAEQLEETDRAEAWRARGDLLLASLHRVPEGASEVTLPGFEGGEVTLELDPGISPAANADRFYREAGRLDRARDRLPALIAEARAEADRHRKALERVERGELPEAVGREGGGRARGDGDEAGRGIFRRYRTSGGLEVRVGRGRKQNDRLTFGHSAPDDLWLHARSVPGSHVILRWQGQDDPPRRDLAEAASLAAWFSKARSSGTVAVDWTRRKHVRKPRGAPPGAVTPGQVRTLFVEPDGSVERRLRADPGS
jgi:predicted ribosome quality control (RQC) complex YloA/Tae2 family protein